MGIKELEGAIFRSSVMQVAATLRTALVMNLSRSEQNRGKLVVQDMDHLAAVFEGVLSAGEGCPAGMVLTASPHVLKTYNFELNACDVMKDALGGIKRTIRSGGMQTAHPS